jgi:hypothetical protein
LISAHDQPTDHPLIRRAREPKRDKINLDLIIKQMVIALDNWDERKTYTLIKELVPEFSNESKS